jgi:hypothetical protein
LTTLRQTTTIPILPSDIYNLFRSFKKEQKHGLSANDALIQHLQNKNIYYKVNITSENRIQYLFIAYPQSIQQALINQDVILVDNTYKTNKFDIPLLHLVGIYLQYPGFYTNLYTN